MELHLYEHFKLPVIRIVLSMCCNPDKYFDHMLKGFGITPTIFSFLTATQAYSTHENA